MTALVAVYTAAIGAYLVLENRSPQSTFAWLLLLLTFPIGGLVIYGMFGRSWHAFSRGKILTKLMRGSELAERSARLISVQHEKIEQLSQGDHAQFGRLATMLWASSGSPLTTVNRLEILQNASEKYPRLLDDLRAATHSIHLLYYEWASDPFTEEVGRLLGDKVREGVEVRILYDPVGSYWMITRKYIRWMRGMGIQMFPFSPMYRLHTLSYRNHRKIAVIDGKVAYSGGLNMTEKHLTGPDGFSGWRDTHTRVSGEAALVLQAVFATMWHNTIGENVFQDEYFPEFDEDGPRLPIQVVSAGPDSEWKAIRQAKVEQHRVRAVGGGPFECLFSGSGRRHLIARKLEHETQHLAVGVVIFHNQDGGMHADDNAWVVPPGTGWFPDRASRCRVLLTASAVAVLRTRKWTPPGCPED